MMPWSWGVTTPAHRTGVRRGSSASRADSVYPLPTGFPGLSTPAGWHTRPSPWPWIYLNQVHVCPIYSVLLCTKHWGNQMVPDSSHKHGSPTFTVLFRWYSVCIWMFYGVIWVLLHSWSIHRHALFVPYCCHPMHTLYFEIIILCFSKTQANFSK